MTLRAGQRGYMLTLVIKCVNISVCLLFQAKRNGLLGEENEMVSVIYVYISTTVGSTQP